jgi:hypothetical protein
MTRMFCSGMAKKADSAKRSTCGIWVDDHRVISSATQVATTARGSIAQGMSRCCRYSRSITTGASRKAASTSPCAKGHTKHLLPASCTLGEPSSRAARMSSTGGRGS